MINAQTAFISDASSSAVNACIFLVLRLVSVKYSGEKIPSKMIRASAFKEFFVFIIFISPYSSAIFKKAVLASFV